VTLKTSLWVRKTRRSSWARLSAWFRTCRNKTRSSSMKPTKPLPSPKAWTASFWPRKKFWSKWNWPRRSTSKSSRMNSTQLNRATNSWTIRTLCSAKTTGPKDMKLSCVQTNYAKKLQTSKRKYSGSTTWSEKRTDSHKILTKSSRTTTWFTKRT